METGARRENDNIIGAAIQTGEKRAIEVKQHISRSVSTNWIVDLHLERALQDTKRSQNHAGKRLAGSGGETVCTRE